MAKLVIGTNKSVVVPAIVKEVTPVEPYALLSRVKDDSNNEIGTVCAYQVDANNQKYAVVCLDAQYRLANTQWCSNDAAVPNIERTTTALGLDSTYTATQNTTAMIDFITSGGYTSSAATHCRSKSFVIGGVTYYGQLPTLSEIYKMFDNRVALEDADPTKTQYSSVALAEVDNKGAWSSSERGATVVYVMPPAGFTLMYQKTTATLITIPVLEIPIQ